MKIVIIEDDSTIVELLTVLLELEGFKPSVINNATIASIVSSVQDIKPDVILMDVNLKGVIGLELTKAIRSQTSFPQPRILMWSGMPLKNECIAAGANDFLMKPFDPDKLISWIRTP
ncbi:MAG: response regulator [Anaerolineae bacterium]|jgi:DNA-binding response OmpR family regulator|nr:response regulator [Anaerolineae bacterium]